MRRLVIGTMVFAIAVVSTACGSGISASNCDELADETLSLVQRLIDDVDAEAGDRSLSDFLASADELPSLDEYRSQSSEIDALAAELGCDADLTRQVLSARAGELTAETDLGRFIIQSIRTGGF